MATDKHESEMEPEVTAQDYCVWVRNELKLEAKAHELRTKELNAILKDGESGQLSTEEMSQRTNKFTERWGNSLCHLMSAKGMSDEEIVSSIDKYHTEERERQMKWRQQEDAQRPWGRGR